MNLLPVPKKKAAAAAEAVPPVLVISTMPEPLPIPDTDGLLSALESAVHRNDAPKIYETLQTLRDYPLLQMAHWVTLLHAALEAHEPRLVWLQSVTEERQTAAEETEQAHNAAVAAYYAEVENAGQDAVRATGVKRPRVMDLDPQSQAQAAAGLVSLYTQAVCDLQRCKFYLIEALTAYSQGDTQKGASRIETIERRLVACDMAWNSVRHRARDLRLVIPADL